MCDFFTFFLTLNFFFRLAFRRPLHLGQVGNNSEGVSDNFPNSSLFVNNQKKLRKGCVTNVLYRKEREEWYFKGENLRELYRSGVVIFFILDGSFFLEATMYTEGFLLSNTIALFTQPLGFGDRGCNN